MAYDITNLITDAKNRISVLSATLSTTQDEVWDAITSKADSITEDLEEPALSPRNDQWPQLNRPQRTKIDGIDTSLNLEFDHDLALNESTSPTDASVAIPESPTVDLSGLFDATKPDDQIDPFSYNAPEFKLPQGDVGRVDIPVTAPTVDMAGLFEIDRPDATIEAFTEQNPTLLEPSRVVARIPSTSVTLDTSNLFKQTPPEIINNPFNEADPELNIDALADEIAQIAKPIIAELEFPVISSLTLDEVPEVEIPDFLLAETPEGLSVPEDYGRMFETKFGVSQITLSGFIDDRVNKLLDKLAPEYQRLARSLTDKLVDNSDALPDEYETALFNRAVLRAKQELLAAEEAILDQHAKRGFVAPPGAVNAALNRARYNTAEALTAQATEIYARRRESEVQHRQFIISQTAQQMDSIRNYVTQQTQLELAFLKTCADVTSAALGFYVQVFEHLAKRADVQVQIMNALNAHYDTKLKAAFAELERFKLYLEAEGQKAQVEGLKMQAIESQIRAKNLEIQGYSAMIDAITKRAAMEELKLKHYQTKADVYRTQIQAQVASYDLYKAQIEGDKAKLQGELAKLEVVDKKLQAAALEADIEYKNNQIIQSYNDTQLKRYQSAVDIYRVKVQAQAATFDVYKAALAGDSEKLKGRLAQLQVYEMQLKAAGVQVDIQRNIDASIAEYNRVLAQKFTAETQVYEAEIRAKVAAFDIYKAALQGDMAMVEAELAKVKVFESQIRAEGLKLDVNKTMLTAIREFNEVQLQKYKGDATLYEMQLNAAVKRISTELEAERLSSEIYRVDMDAAKIEFSAAMDAEKTERVMELEEYKTRADVMFKRVEVLLKQLAPLAQVGAQAIQSTGSVATAAANSLNTMVSASMQEVVN